MRAIQFLLLLHWLLYGGRVCVAQELPLFAGFKIAEVERSLPKGQRKIVVSSDVSFVMDDPAKAGLWSVNVHILPSTTEAKKEFKNNLTRDVGFPFRELKKLALADESAARIATNSIQGNTATHIFHLREDNAVMQIGYVGTLAQSVAETRRLHQLTQNPKIFLRGNTLLVPRFEVKYQKVMPLGAFANDAFPWSISPPVRFKSTDGRELIVTEWGNWQTLRGVEVTHTARLYSSGGIKLVPVKFTYSVASSEGIVTKTKVEVTPIEQKQFYRQRNAQPHYSGFILYSRRPNQPFEFQRERFLKLDGFYDYKLQISDAQEAALREQAQNLWQQIGRDEWKPWYRPEGVHGSSSIEMAGITDAKTQTHRAMVFNISRRYQSHARFYWRSWFLNGRHQKTSFYVEQDDPLPPGAKTLEVSDILRPEILQPTLDAAGQPMPARFWVQSGTFRAWSEDDNSAPTRPRRKDGPAIIPVRILLITLISPDEVDLSFP